MLANLHLVESKMATLQNRAYRHYGVLLPHGPQDEEWTSNRRINEQGYIFIRNLKKSSVLKLQSVGSSEIIVNKVCRPGSYDQDVPEELRVSTAPQALVRLPRPRKINGIETIHFNELLHWQRLSDNTYSLYFR